MSVHCPLTVSEQKMMTQPAAWITIMDLIIATLTLWHGFDSQQFLTCQITIKPNLNRPVNQYIHCDHHHHHYQRLKNENKKSVLRRPMMALRGCLRCVQYFVFFLNFIIWVSLFFKYNFMLGPKILFSFTLWIFKHVCAVYWLAKQIWIVFFEVNWLSLNGGAL